MNNFGKLLELDQSVWLDFVQRTFIASGELKQLIDEGVRGVTSNPTIFEKAIVGSEDYDEELRRLIAEGRSVQETYEVLAKGDIAQAADQLLPVYQESDGRDGYVSIEVSPELSHDAAGTILEGKRLFQELGRLNIMIKVPATKEGMTAIRSLVGSGVNVNVTLIFSLAHYEAAAIAYIDGLADLAQSGGDVSRVGSVASFFVSRVDTAIDRLLEEKGDASLLGKIAIANAKAAYARFGELFNGDRWELLQKQGARVQRVLWASTGTKNPSYPDTLYLDNLIGANTVNTVPPATMDAFLDHGKVAQTIDIGLDEAYTQLEALKQLGIDLDAVSEYLQDQGLAAFVDSFRALLNSIEVKRGNLTAVG